MADHGWMNAGLEISPDPQHGRSFRRANPLVEVPDVVARAEARQLEREHAGRVRAVDQRLDPALAESGDDLLDRKDQASRARHVVDEREPHPRARSLADPMHDLLRICEWEGDLGHDELRARPLAHEVERVLACGIGVVGREQRIAGSKGQGAENGAHS